jgi:hypothetical protein
LVSSLVQFFFSVISLFGMNLPCRVLFLPHDSFSSGPT